MTGTTPRLAILPVRIAIRVAKIEDIRTVGDAERKQADEADMIRREMQRVAADLGGQIEKRVAAGGHFDVVSAAAVEAALRANGLDVEGTPDADRVRQIGDILHVDAVLVVKLSGYGKIKKKWQAYLIGSGVVEGVVQGVVAATVVNNVWVGVAVATEEILQEIVTWGGGLYLFDRYFTPVILESELRSTADGAVIWSDTAMAEINRKALKKLPEDERSRKEVRLQATASRAARDLAKALEKSARRNAR